MWLLEAAREDRGVHTVVFGTQVLELEEVFYHHLFLLYAEVDLCTGKGNDSGVVQAGECGLANHMVNLIQWTVPLDVHTSVKIFCSISSLSSLV